MKRIGLIGGLSWYSSIEYYRKLNLLTEEHLGAHQQGNIVLVNVDLHEFRTLLNRDDNSRAIDLLISAAKTLESAGCDLILLCSNGVHQFFYQVEDSITTEMLHIADATAEKLSADGIKRVGLLGTKFTMEQGFYKNRVTEKYGIEVIVPSEDEQNTIHDVIYNELCLGQINNESREKYLETIKNLRSQGAEAVILGCTEIALPVQQQHTQVPLYDTTKIHATQAVKLATA